MRWENTEGGTLTWLIGDMACCPSAMICPTIKTCAAVKLPVLVSTQDHQNLRAMHGAKYDIRAQASRSPLKDAFIDSRSTALKRKLRWQRHKPQRRYVVSCLLTPSCCNI